MNGSINGRFVLDSCTCMKLPDAIIAATAVVLDAPLITADERLRRLVWPRFIAIPASA
jgi:predicted nucleic acid-binding protein